MEIQRKPLGPYSPHRVVQHCPSLYKKAISEYIMKSTTYEIGIFGVSGGLRGSAARESLVKSLDIQDVTEIAC
jgi:hypothetical protein